MKQFATWFTHGVPGGAKLRSAIYQSRTGADVLTQVNAFFSTKPSADEVLETGDEMAFSETPLVCD
jgi:hypothetical protein